MTPTALSDRQARNVILAAEQLGHRREPDLHPRQYDSQLHEDAQTAEAFLADGHPAVLADALVRPDPISADEAAERLTDGWASMADIEQIISAAETIGFSAPEPELPLLECVIRFDQGQAAVAFLWQTAPELLN